MATLYKVQTGAYKSAIGAYAAAAKVKKTLESYLKKIKSEEKISVAVINSGGWYKVQEGAFESKENAEKRKKLIREAGIYAVVLETQTQDSMPAGTPKAKAAEKTDGPSSVLACMQKYLDSKTAHKEIVTAFNKLMKELGHSAINEGSAWCTDFIVLCFHQAGLLDLIGYAKTSAELVETAKEKGTWKEGTSDIQFGDIVIFCDGKKQPNHSEFAIDDKGKTISGNYNGGVHKRSWKNRSAFGRIRPAYKTDAAIPPTFHPRIRVWPIYFFEKDEGQYGDCTAILEYAEDGKTVAHCALIDCAKGSAASVIISKLKKWGVTYIDAIFLSHAHGDHYGGLSHILKAFSVGALYLPDCTELDKYQKSYGNALRNQAKKVKNSRFLTAGDTVTIGHITCENIFMCPASKLKEHDTHHFVNNMSMALRFVLDGKWVFFTAGDLQNEGNKILVSTVKKLKAHIYKFQWHGDRNAILTAMMQVMRPLIAYSNYHHKERSGRGSTRKVAEAVGAVVARNWENGDIFIDCQGGTMKLSCSKGNLYKSFKL